MDKITTKFTDGVRTVTFYCDEATLDAAQQLFNGVKRAERLHPVFAEGIYQGLGRITEEECELAQAINKQHENRIHEEALDLLVVAFRFCRGDWEMKEETGNDRREAPCF